MILRNLNPKHLVLVIPLGVILSSSVFAEQVCNSIQSPQDVLKCALERHPNAKMSKLSYEQIKFKEEWASQIPNPELDSKGTYGKSLGDTITQTEVTLQQPIEFGGKRSARIDLAKSEANLAQVRQYSAQEQIAIATVTNLYRLKQIVVELEIIQEAIGAFDRILKQYQSSVKLSPEKQVSLNVFQLSKSDYMLRETELRQERRMVEAFFVTSTGLSIDIILKHLPGKTTKWPSPVVENVSNSEYKLSLANLQLAKSDHELSKSNSWPTLNIGPTFSFQSEGGIRYPTYGIAISFPLPLFNVNGGQRAFTRSGIDRAEREVSIKKQTLDIKKQRLLDVYDSSIEALRKAPTMERLTKQHNKLEKLFLRGLVTAPLVIEAHRQILDFAQNKHSHEIRARKALWELYALKGTILQENL